MTATALGRLRLIGLLEGTSFLLLLGVAMPLKYLAGMPMAVSIVGWAHGVLFVAYCGALVAAARQHSWSLERAVTALLAALLPFGPFVLDRSLKREQQAGDAASAASN